MGPVFLQDIFQFYCLEAPGYQLSKPVKLK